MSDLTWRRMSRVAVSGTSAEARWSRRTGLGARLRNGRLSLRMSIEDLASGLTSVAYLSRLEADERCPSPALAAALAARLGIGVDDLILPEDRVSPGLGAELLHADLLLAVGQVDDALWVSDDLVEVATGIGEREIAHAARIVHAFALTAAGNPRAAIRTVRPLSNGPLGTIALAAQARFQLDLGEHHRALEVGQSAADRMAASGHVSFCAAADLAVTLCQSYQALGRNGFAAHIAHLALRDLPPGLGDAAASGRPQPVSFRSRSQSVTNIERAVGELHQARLCDDIGLLQAFGPPTSSRAALSTFGPVRRAVS